ncbi:penicillin-binding protein 1C [Vibrio sp. F74]|uniref:penicillin-binding protein 1C n=1 Tax=Vibrio sp. F74 TaxID=700020 RepID=UPI0035F59315
MPRFRQLYRGLIIGLVLFTGMVGLLNHLYPLPELYPNGHSTVVTSRHGEVLRSFANREGIHSYQVSSDHVDGFYLDALLNYEDRWFYYHPGVNPLSLIRATWQWIDNGYVVSGGSTITMQVARLIDPHSRSILGKIKQVWRAFQIEWRYNKEEILNYYLNLAPFGGNIQGVEAASLRYFNKSARKLTKNEAALLVVLPQRPSLNRPDRYAERAKAMRNKVLARLTKNGLISQEEFQLLAKESVKVKEDVLPLLAPLLSRKLQRENPRSTVITTTIDYELQQKVTKLMSRLKYSLPRKTSSAVVIVNNKNAEVLAYQGSVDFTDQQRFAHVDMVQAIRSPGSTLKPFIYGLALDLGIIHSESLLSDIPSSFSGYKPNNLSGEFIGAVSVSNALKLSLNVPAIQVFNRVTPEVFDERLAQAGVHLQHKKANLSVGLGGTGTNLMVLASLYRSLANHGLVNDLRLMKDQPLNNAKPLLSDASSWIIFDTLSDLSAPDRVVPSARRKIAWKTGTSYGYRDFWSVGVSSDYTVAVWVGRPDASPLVGYLGATQAAPIMFDVFDLLPRDISKIKQPALVSKVLTCWPSGRSYASNLNGPCLRKTQSLTINRLTPPSMQTNGSFVIGDRWPEALNTWQKKHSILVDSAQQAKIAITSLRTGQHYYQSQLESLPLTVNSERKEVRWFVNHQPYFKKKLVLAEYKNEVKISACVKMICDQKIIHVHE